MKRSLAFLGLLCGLAFTTTAAPVPPPEKLLPGDTVFLLTTPDYAKSSAVWDKWPGAMLWNDVSMKPFRDKFVKKFKTDIAEPLEKELGIKFADYTGLAQGQVTFALLTPSFEEDAKAPAFFLLVDARDKSDALKTNLTALKKKWIDAGKQTRTDKIRDVEFSTLIFKSDEVGKIFDKVFPDPNFGNETLEPPKPKKTPTNVELIMGQSGSLFILGNSARDIEKLLAAQAGSGVSTLADNAAYAKSHSALFRDTQGYAWVHLKPLVDGVVKLLARRRQEGGGGPAGLPALDKLFGALGFTTLQDVAINLRDTGDGALFNVNVHVPESGRKGLLKVFSFEAKDANPPPFVPADAIKFSRVRLDMHKAWNTLEQTIVEAFPPAANVIKMFVDVAGKDKDPEFDIRKQLFANLGDDIVHYEKAPRKQTLEDLSSPPALTLISSPKPEQLAGAVKALTAVMPMGGKIKEREFLGRKVYSMNIPTPPRADGKAEPRALSYAASGGYVAFSTDTATLEEFMRAGDSAAKSLRDTPGLADAAQKVGGMSTGFFGYENSAETMRALLEILKKDSGALANLFGNLPMAGRLGMEDGAKQFKDWIDFSLLPSYDKVAKYFYISVFSGSLNADGFSFKAYAPNPPGMRK